MTVAIGLGLMEFPFAGAGDYWRWVDLCEAGGVDSLWQTDRLVSRQPILECMAVMAALAGRTRRLRFGMNVVSLALRDPVLLAKQCATIDVLSEGRLLPGFGIGSPLGALVGGLILGVVQQVSTAFLLPTYKPAVAFLVLILLLFVRPRGLFGGT